MCAPGNIFDIPFALAIVEVPPAWTGHMHKLIGQSLMKRVLVIVVGDAVNVKLVVASFRHLVREEIAVITLVLFNISRKMGSYRMAENMLCVLSCDVPSGVKLPKYLSFVEGSWSGVLPVTVVSCLFRLL